MMTGLRRLTCVAAILALFSVGCSSPSTHERVVSDEVDRLNTLEHHYPGVVTGFDVRGDTTLIVTLDLQSYIGMSDDDAAAMKHAVVERWRSVWSALHPHEHATLHVRFIDFIGRKIAEQSVKV
jgi:hypothetical protein